MSKKLLGKLLVCILFFSFLFFLIFFILKNNFNSNLRISVLDVGQGDAILIKLPTTKNILIDGGPDNKVLRQLGENLPFYRRQIDYLIISHFHQDHIYGLVEVLRRYQVNNLIYGHGLETFFPAEILLSEARSQGTNIIVLKKDIEINFDDSCSMIILNPAYFFAFNENDSLISRLDCYGTSFLSSGDNEKEVELALLQTKFELSAQIFKASHHGSKTSNTSEFLKKVNPNLMIISAGKDNKFNHPSKEVLNLADTLGIEIKRTDVSGTVNILANIEN